MKQSTLYAPASYWTTPERVRELLTNGCGRKGILGLLVPDKLYGCPIHAACDIHDWMYGEGRTLADKDEADRVFLNNMLRLITTYGGYRWLQSLRYRAARIYYRSVCLFGGPAFWQGKNDEATEGMVEI